MKDTYYLKLLMSQSKFSRTGYRLFDFEISGDVFDCTVQMLSNGTDRSKQTGHTLIRLLLEEQIISFKS